MDARPGNIQLDRMQSHYQTLIVGGGTAGIMVAAQLKRRRRELSVAIVEPSGDHWYQAAWTLVGAGAFDKRRSRRNEADLIPAGVDWIQDRAISVEPEVKEVRTEKERFIGYN